VGVIFEPINTYLANFILLQMKSTFPFLVLIKLALLLQVSLLAQEQPKSHTYFCGHDILLNHYEASHPGFRDAVARTFAEAKMNAFLSNQTERSSTAYTIPVVVHIVWRDPEENLHDSVIFNQIDRLNEDFRRLNEDASNIREMFAERHADSGIQFEVTEIRRVQTTATFTPLLITLPDQVKRSAQGGSDAADPSAYLNIWICRIRPVPLIGGQVFGYAYPPANLPNWPAGASAPSPELDGVVVDFRCIGANNPNPMNVQGFGTIFQNGRTLVHEIGHYLGLRHIWGDGGGLFGGNSCEADDGVSDTPNQGRASNYDCNPNQNTCEAEPELDMIENYMDYSDQACQIAFTQGQVAIMHSVLEGPRRGLISGTASTKTLAKVSSYKIYPNPVSSELTLSFSKAHQGKNVAIFHHDGALVRQMNISEAETTINISTLPAGFYFISCDNEVQKFVKIN
jgi:hypothetical protein